MFCRHILRRDKGAKYPEEIFGGAGVERAVEDFGLFRQIIGRLYGREHSLYGEKGGQVCRVRRYDDESEEPPRAAHDPPRHRPAHQQLTK